MKSKTDQHTLIEACRKGTLPRLVERYVRQCHRAPPIEEESTEALVEEKTKKGKSGKRAAAKNDPCKTLPNLAGFCRFLGVGTQEAERAAREFPEQIEYLYAVLEDEALNSGYPTALLSLYMKGRLGYLREREEGDQSEEESGLKVCFEHDVFRDGE